jgi:predicted RNA-binding protein YlqC (UPF0109 family)
MASSIDQQFVEYVVKSLVNNPDGVKVDRRIDEKGVLLELTVDADDLGRVIGKRGATAQSLRTLLRALGTKNEARYNLKIVDVDKPESERGGVSAGATSTVTSDDDDDQSDDGVAQEPVEEKASKTSSPKAEESPVKAEPVEAASDAVARTRQELAELDDLDI